MKSRIQVFMPTYMYVLRLQPRQQRTNGSHDLHNHVEMVKSRNVVHFDYQDEEIDHNQENHSQECVHLRCAYKGSKCTYVTMSSMRSMRRGRFIFGNRLFFCGMNVCISNKYGHVYVHANQRDGPCTFLVVAKK